MAVVVVVVEGSPSLMVNRRCGITALWASSSSSGHSWPLCGSGGRSPSFVEGRGGESSLSEALYWYETNQRYNRGRLGKIHTKNLNIRRWH